MARKKASDYERRHTRDGWQYTCRVSVRDPFGNRRQPRVYGKTVAELEAAAARARAEAARPAAGEATVAEAVAAWLPAADIGQNTAYQYAKALDRHVLPRVGALRLADVTTPLLTKLWRELGEAGVGAATVRKCHQALAGALAHAADQGLLDRNPARGARRPPERPVPKPRWGAREVAAFLAGIADNEPYERFFAFLALTGCRIGEAIALRWDDVDLARGEARIARTATRDALGRETTGDRPKAPRSNRVLMLAPETRALLSEERAAQAHRRAALGRRWREGGLVFDRGDGEPIRAATANRRLARWGRRLGLPPVTAHGLRHAHGTIQRRAGVPVEVVAAGLGNTARTTLAVYSHLGDDAELRREAAERAAAAIRRAGEG